MAHCLSSLDDFAFWVSGKTVEVRTNFHPGSLINQKPLEVLPHASSILLSTCIMPALAVFSLILFQNMYFFKSSFIVYQTFSPSQEKSLRYLGWGRVGRSWLMLKAAWPGWIVYFILWPCLKGVFGSVLLSEQILFEWHGFA